MLPRGSTTLLGGGGELVFCLTDSQKVPGSIRSVCRSAADSASWTETTPNPYLLLNDIRSHWKSLWVQASKQYNSKHSIPQPLHLMTKKRRTSKINYNKRDAILTHNTVECVSTPTWYYNTVPLYTLAYASAQVKARTTCDHTLHKLSIIKSPRLLVTTHQSILCCNHTGV